MGRFARKTKGLRPFEKSYLINVANLERFGKEWKGVSDGDGGVWSSNFESELAPLAHFDPAHFLKMLSDIADSDDGGWTGVGACSLAIGMGVMNPESPHGNRLLEHDMTWCKQQNVPSRHLTGYEHDWWRKYRGNGKTYPDT